MRTFPRQLLAFPVSSQRLAVLLICSLWSNSPVAGFAQTTWNASIDTNWSNVANWSSGEPTLATDAILPTPIPLGGATLMLAEGELAKSLTFNATGYVLNGGTLQLASPGNITVTTSGHIATINSILTGANGLTKLGAGNLVLGGANNFTGLTRVMNGTLTLASGGSIGIVGTPGSLRVGERSTATLIAQAGSQLSVGNGSSSYLHVGSRGNIAGSTATVGTLNLSALTNFTANVGEFHIGVGSVSASGTTRGVVHLATNNTITASTNIIVGDMEPALDNTTVISELNWGAGNNIITTPVMIIGGSRSQATSTLAPGGTLTLNNGAGTTNLIIGRNNVDSTNLTSRGVLDLSQGTFIANLGQVIIGGRSNSPSGANGAGDGTLTIGASANNTITANSVIISNLETTSGGTTQGVLNFAGGTFAVSGNVTLAHHAANGGTSRGTLNITGGIFSVGGNIIKSNKTTSIATINLEGGTLDMTDGTITASQLAWRDGDLINVAAGGVVLDAASGDALIFRDKNLSFNISLTSTTANNIHYEAASPTASGAILGGNLNLNNAARTFNIEDNALAAIDTDITGIISSTGTNGGLIKTGAGTLRLSNANTHTGATTVSDGRLILNHANAIQNSTLTLNTPNGVHFAAGITNFTLGGLAGNASSVLNLVDANSQAVHLTIGQNNANSTFSGVIQGAGTITKVGTGTLTLAGASANTFTPTVNINQGSITLNKADGVQALGGNINLSGGGSLIFIAGRTGQLASTANISINGNNSTFNGTATNSNNAAIINETIASLTVTRGVVNMGLGSNSRLTVTGTTSFTGSSGSTNNTSTMFIGSSGSTFTTHTLILTNMNGTGGTDAANSFTIFGNNTSFQTTAHIGSGGLTLNNSTFHLHKGSDSNALGGRVILDGNLTTIGGSPSSIIHSSGANGRTEIELSSTSAAVQRTISTGADLLINVDIKNGASTNAGIIKTGTAKLTLSGNNSYTGQTSVNEGTLSFAASQHLGDATSATNTISLGNGSTLQYTGTIESDLGIHRDLLLPTGSATIDVSNAEGTLTLSGDITATGTGQLTKTGLGTLRLIGTDLSGINQRDLLLGQGGLSFRNELGIAVNLGSHSLALGNHTTLFFDVGSLSNFDSISTSAIASIDPNATIHLYVSSLADMTANTTYNLITAGAGSSFDNPNYTWSLNLAGSFQYQLNTTDTQVQLQTLAAITGDAWWHGDLDGSWSRVDLGQTLNTNWATDSTGTTDRGAGPGIDTTVYFSTTNASGPNITTTLDQHIHIKNLIFTSNPAAVTNVTIAQGTVGSLTLTPTDPTTGIQTQDNSGAIAITAPVHLGASQTWTVSDTNSSLTLSGPISGNSDTSLTKSGAGMLTLSGTNTYTGRTIINQGTLSINTEAALGANPGTFTADQLTLNGGTLRTTANFVIDDSNRGITLGSSGGTFNVNNSTTLTISNVIAGSGNLTKSSGTGNLILNRANTYSGDTTILHGTITLANGGSIGVASATAGSLIIGNATTGTLTAQAGSSLKVGNGASSKLYVGTRTANTNSATTGTLNLANSGVFVANVGEFYIGHADPTINPGTGARTSGTVTLSNAGNNITASVGVIVGDSQPSGIDNTANNLISTLTFGSGVTQLTTPSLLIGGRKSRGTASFGANPGGTLILNNGDGGKTDLYLGRNFVNGTSTNAVGTLDLSNGTFIATLGKVILGERSDNNGGASETGGAATGSGVGVLTLGAADNVVTADSLILGNLLGRGHPSITTKGTLNMAGGTFTIAGNVSLGIQTSVDSTALSEGVINLTGGTLTVGGDIITTNKASSTATIDIDGGTLDMTNGIINANNLNARSGALKDVAQINGGDGATPAALTKTTTGTLLLLGTNSYTGATLVNEGVLEVRGTTGTGATTIAGSATLAGTGTVQSLTGTTIQTNGLLKAGDNGGDDIGTLTINHSLTFGTGSSSIFQLSAATGNSTDPLSIDPAFLDGNPGNHDHIDITGSLNLASNTTIKIDLLNYIPNFGDVFNLIDWTATGNAISTGFDPDSAFDFTNAVLSGGLTWKTDRFLSSGIIYVIPEPSRALLILIGAAWTLSRRRRRQPR